MLGLPLKKVQRINVYTAGLTKYICGLYFTPYIRDFEPFFWFKCQNIVISFKNSSRAAKYSQ